MEIDITTLATEGDMFDFSASQAERGMNAGPETWANSMEEAKARPILTDDQLDEFRDFLRGFGAWEDEEIDGWSSQECNAFFIQICAGELREMQALAPGDGLGGIDWAAHHDLVAGRIYPGDDGKLYIYIGD